MCGRFNIIADPLTKLIMSIINGEPGDVQLDTRYNISPTENVPVLLKTVDGDWDMRDMRWWLVPYWSPGPSTKYAMFNARSETLQKSRAFQQPFKQRRCIVPGSGYYEWRKEAGVKVPYLVQPAHETGFAFAGLCDRWQGQVDGEDRVIESCTIITGAAAGEMKALHNRVPIHLSEDEITRWLNLETSVDELSQVLSPHMRMPIAVTPLSSYVSNARHKDSRCIEPLGETKIIH